MLVHAMSLLLLNAFTVHKLTLYTLLLNLLWHAYAFL